MKTTLFPALLLSVSWCLSQPAESKEPKKSSQGIPSEAPKKAQPPAAKPGGTTMDVRTFLIGTKWSWRNVNAGVPERECVFMADGTFRHPHFVAKFTVKDPHTVVLTKKGGKAVLTFDTDYKNFEALDFTQLRITGSKL